MESRDKRNDGGTVQSCESFINSGGRGYVAFQARRGSRRKSTGACSLRVHGSAAATQKPPWEPKTKRISKPSQFRKRVRRTCNLEARWPVRMLPVQGGSSVRNAMCIHSTNSDARLVSTYAQYIEYYVGYSTIVCRRNSVAVLGWQLEHTTYSLRVCKKSYCEFVLNWIF